MSHFTVLVIGDNPEGQLAPYQENNMGDCPTEYLSFNDQEDEFREDYETGTSTRVLMPDGSYKFPWDNDFRKEGAIGTGSNTHEVPANYEQKEIPHKEIYASFENFVEDWHSHSERDPQMLRYGYWENHNAKWDWYQLGGRWTGFFKLKEGAIGQAGEPGLMRRGATQGYADAAYKSDIDFVAMKQKTQKESAEIWDKVNEAIKATPPCESWTTVRDEMFKGDVDSARTFYHEQERVKAFNSKALRDIMGVFADLDEYDIPKDDFINRRVAASFTTFALVKDGVWFEKGTMGWWDAVSDKKDQDVWNNEFIKLLDSVSDDTLLSVYDCHI